MPGNSSEDNSGTTGGTTGGSSSPGVADPFVSEAWHLDNTGQSTYSSGNADGVTDINLTGAALTFTGDGVRIAVSDTGTEMIHEDLDANALTGEHRNYGPADPNQWRQSYGANNQGTEYHGTAVTGLICAEANNGKGSKGVAPDASFAAFRFVIDYDTGMTEASYLARNIDQADGNFDIFNYSYGYAQCRFNEEDSLALDAFRDGVTNLRNGKGAIYVQSAGNDFLAYLHSCLGNNDFVNVFTGNTNHNGDLAIPYKIITGAYNANGEKSTYSTPGSGIWISAPGGEYGNTEPAMLTTDVSGCAKGYAVIGEDNNFNSGLTAGNRNCNYTSYMNGTSSAAPISSGVIALMLQANPELTWREIKHILAMTAEPIDTLAPNLQDHPYNLDRANIDYDYKWVTNGAGIPFSNWYGFGRINALEAVLAATSFVNGALGTFVSTQNPVTEQWYYSTGLADLNMAIPDDGTSDFVDSTITVNHNFIVEAVQVKVNIDHARPGDIGLVLRSPSGIESRLIHFNNGIYSTSFLDDQLLLTNAFYGEESFGSWTLMLIDGTAGVAGNLDNWQINIFGRKGTPDGSAPAAITALSTISPYPSDTVSTLFSFTNSVSGDVIRYEASVGTTPGGTDIAGWTSIGLTNVNAQLLGLTLIDDTTYYINVRAVDESENTSLPITMSWIADFI